MLRGPLARLRRAGAVRRASALLASLALLLQLGVPLAHDPVGLGTFAPWLGAPLCHAGSDTANRSLPSDQPAPADRKSSLCPICVSLQVSGSFVAPPAGISLVAVAITRASPAPPRAAPYLAYAFGFTSQPRGPPAA